MATVNSAWAFETLGLEPGADQAAIERAYKALIKRHHPDRQGGDALRAAEINQAYFQLRKGVDQAPERPAPVSVADAIYARPAARLRRRGRRGGRRILPIILIAAAATAYFEREWIGIWAGDRLTEIQGLIEPSSNDGVVSSARPTGPVLLDSDIDRAIIASAVGRARLLQRRGNEDALAHESRSCHQRLRSAPTLGQLDRCAAFDNAVLELQRRDPLRDEGPFAATAITARQMTGASTLSDDYLAIEGRLDRVRMRVQLLLEPPPPVPPQPTTPEQPSGLAEAAP